jgi:cytochrome c-type protein NapB
MIKMIKIIALGSLLIGSSLYAADVVDINKEANAAANLKKDDLGNKKEITEVVFGLRKTNLYEEKAETTGMKVQYNDAAPGTSQRIERAFQDAPPMIPHSVEGLLPIKTGNNQCLGCHMPEVAPSVKAVAIPKSHFTNFRPKHKLVGQDFTRVTDGNKNEISIEKLDKLSMSRFNCSQCHAPQSTGALAVSNTFQADFSDKDGGSTSTWYERMDDALDTVGDASHVTAEDLANKNSAAGSLDH